MNRIVVLGASGTGKTTICRKLSDKLNLKALHLDSVYWKKNWENIDKTEFDSYMKKFLTKNRYWVIDGNYTNNNHFKYRLDLSDTIIYLDFGTQIALKGIHERADQFKHQVRSDMAEGCIEGIDQVFLQYTAFYSKFRSKKLSAIVSNYKNNKKVLVFKTRKELDDWFNTL